MYKRYLSDLGQFVSSLLYLSTVCHPTMVTKETAWISSLLKRLSSDVRNEKSVRRGIATVTRESATKTATEAVNIGATRSADESIDDTGST